MPTFIQKKCPTCGGRLENISGNQYECRCCHNVFELNDRNANLYHDLELAASFRESLDFKQAENWCKRLLNTYKEDNLADVYWSLLLCEQRVVFEMDQNGEQFPSFYDIVSTEIEDSEYYVKTVEYLKAYIDVQRIEQYNNLVEKMNAAKRKYRAINNSTKPYDIFICFKKSSLRNPNTVTKDYKMAYNLYNALCRDYRVFFSEESLRNIVVSEYEPNIYHALYTSKIMLVICSDINLLNSQWVKNEWFRFKAMTKTSAQEKVIIPIFRDKFQPEQLPDELRSCQGMREDMNLMLYLTNRIKAILNPVDKQAEFEAKIAEFEAFKKQFTEQNKASAPQYSVQSAPPQSVQKPTPPVSGNSNDISAKLMSTPQPKPAVVQNPPQTQTSAPKAVKPTEPVNVAKPVAVQSVQPQQKAVQSKPAEPNYIVPYGTKEITSEQFVNRNDLKTVIIPNTVISIGWAAFKNCRSLTSVVIPDSVMNIDVEAFSGCSELTSVTIGNGVTSIGVYAFANTAWYNSQSDGLVYAGKVAYKYKGTMPANTSITLKEGTTYICSDVFKDCSGLARIAIPDSVTGIGYSAFSGCSSLREMTIPFIGKARAKMSSSSTLFGYIFGERSYEGGTATKQYSIPTSHVYYIPTSLKKVTVTGGNILDNAFHNCSNLTDITIGSGITSIGKSAFKGCSSLTSIAVHITDIDKWCEITYKTNPLDHAHNLYLNGKLVTDIVIPNTVTGISEKMFYGCRGLKSITIPESVTSIGDFAFDGCSGLTDITIPDSVTSIGMYAFYNTAWYANQPNGVVYLGKVAYDYKGTMPADTSITLKEGTKGIACSAFSCYDCKNMTSIVIPNSVTCIGGRAFEGCSGLTEMTIPFVGAEAGKTSSDTYQYPFGYIFGERSYEGGTETKQYYYGSSASSTTYSTYYIPTSLKKVTVTGGNILDGAFHNCLNLKYAIMGNGVTSIGSAAFFDCSELADVIIPESVTSIGIGAFCCCSKLTDITIPESVTSIGGCAFKGCSGLTDITIPESVINIDDEAFGYCSQLKDIKYLGTKKQWHAIKKFAKIRKKWDKGTGKYVVHCTDGDLKK